MANCGVRQTWAKRGREGGLLTRLVRLLLELLQRIFSSDFKSRYFLNRLMLKRYEEIPAYLSPPLAGSPPTRGGEVEGAEGEVGEAGESGGAVAVELGILAPLSPTTRIVH